MRLPERTVLLETAGVVFVFLYYAWSCIGRSTPTIVPDEFGYLAQASYLAGEGGFNMTVTPYYHFGYSILLSPLFAFLDDPESIYTGAMLINAALAAAVIPLLLRIATDFEIPRSPLLIVAAIIVASWPSYYLVAHYAWSEPLIRVVYLLCVLCAAAVARQPKYLNLVMLSLAAVAVYASHPRGITIPPVAAVFLCVLFMSKHLNARKFAAGMASLVVAFIAVHLTLGFMHAQMWYDGGHISSRLSDHFFDLFTWEGLHVAVLVALGQAWYQVAASLCLLVVGVIFLIGRSRQDWFSRNSLAGLFIVASVLGVAAASWAQMQDPLSYHSISYGRYIDGVSIVLLWLGLAALLTRAKEIPALRSGLVYSALAVTVAALILLHDPLVDTLARTLANNVAGLGVFAQPSEEKWTLFATGSFIGIGGALLLYWLNFRSAMLVICGLFVIVSNAAIRRFQERTMGVEAIVGKHVQAINDAGIGPIYLDRLSVNRWLYRIQYALLQRIDEIKIADLPPDGAIIGHASPGPNFKCVIVFTDDYKIFRPLNVDDTGKGTGKRTFTYQMSGCDRELGEGWSVYERWGIWSIGNRSTLSLPIENPGKDAILTWSIRSYVSEDHPVQRHIFRIADVEIGRQRTEHPGALHTVTMRLPQELIPQSGIVDITIEHPDAVSPKALGRSGDARQIAMGLQSITVEQAP